MKSSTFPQQQSGNTDKNAFYWSKWHLYTWKDKRMKHKTIIFVKFTHADWNIWNKIDQVKRLPNDQVRN